MRVGRVETAVETKTDLRPSEEGRESMCGEGRKQTLTPRIPHREDEYPLHLALKTRQAEFCEFL